ncbi:MAG: hypothetical protein K2Y37_07890 [Pirellulales bacterium]|nr:hypothetical protein [Pirellulales bacterium]
MEAGRLAAVRSPSRIRVVARSFMSAWKSHEVVLREGLTIRRILRMLGHDLPVWLFHRWPIRVPALALSAATLCGFLILRERSTESGTAPSFPPNLKQRAPLLTAAWLDGDLVSMLAMTDPARDRDLRRWYSQTTVPQPPPPDDASGIDARSIRTIDLVSVKHRDGRASVVVRIGSELAGDAAHAVVVEQQWVERRGVWYFAPRMPARGNRRVPAN